MSKIDRQTDKSTRWQFTMFEPQYPLLDVMKSSDLIAEWGCQDEICPETHRRHKQGYFRTVRQVRFHALTIAFPGIHIEAAKNWNALVNYCKKKETRDISGSFLSGTGSGKTPLTMAIGLMKLCAHSSPVFNYIQRGNGHIEIDEINVLDIDKMYISGGDTWLREDPNVIGLISNNQWKSAFVNFFKVWQHFASEVAFYECDQAALVLQAAEDSRSEADEGDEVACGSYAFVDEVPKLVRKQKKCDPIL